MITSAYGLISNGRRQGSVRFDEVEITSFASHNFQGTLWLLGFHYELELTEEYERIIGRSICGERVIETIWSRPELNEIARFSERNLPRNYTVKSLEICYRKTEAMVQNG